MLKFIPLECTSIDGYSLSAYYFLKDESTNLNTFYIVDSGKRRFIAEELAKFGKGNVTSKIFTYRELCLATENFQPTNMIGEGGFGRVYKGTIKNTNQVILQLNSLYNVGLKKTSILIKRFVTLQIVAVKALDRNGFQGNREFVVEVLILSLLHHPNLVNLVGYCAEGDQRVLVYEYMANGSLEDHLLGKLLYFLINTMPLSCNA